MTYKESTRCRRTFNLDGTYGDKPSGLSTLNVSEFSELCIILMTQLLPTRVITVGKLKKGNKYLELELRHV